MSEEKKKRSYRRKKVGFGNKFMWKREDAVEEPEEEEGGKILEGMKLGSAVVESMRGCGSEKELLEWVLENKPEGLGFNREHYLVEEVLEEKWRGLGQKLEIHGWEDRAKRLEYLWSVLKVQWENKKSAFKNITQFLMLMAQRPTGVINLEVDSEIIYKMEPEEEEDSDEDESEKQKRLLLEILGDTAQDPDLVTGSYSSGDSLSDWSVSEEEEEISEKSNNDLPPITRPVRTSSSFGEFKDILQKEDPEKKRKEAELFWREQQKECVEWLEDNIRTFETVPLSSQPVISSRLVLQARFGEFWEWKARNMEGTSKKCSGSVQLHVAFTEDVIREILWQFTITQPKMSPVFMEDWTVRENLMVASLSKTTFDNFVNKFGRILAKLQVLRKFYTSVLEASNPPPGTESNTLPPSKCYRCYASGLEEISIFIMEHIDHLEQEIKRLPRPPRHEDPAGPAVTTFLQLERQTTGIVELVQVAYKVHYQAIPAPEESTLLPWQGSIRLMVCLEAHLIQEIRPSSHGVLLFLWSKCLHATLDDILSALKTLKWSEHYSLFVRDSTISLNDINFWSDCIRTRDIPSICGEFGGNSLQSLQKLLPKVLSILKTCEVFDQLEEDFTQILGAASNLTAELLINSFLKEILPQTSKTPPPEDTNQEPDYFAHFHALGLGESQAINCFRFLLDPKFIQATSQKPSHSKRFNELFTFPDFWNIPKLPIKTYTQVLDTVFSTHFDPFCQSAKTRIQKIFQDYRVLERMTTFQEIILTVREDFARGIIRISSRAHSPLSSQRKKDSVKKAEFFYEDAFSRNAEFQKLLNECYPPETRGDTFSIDLKLEPTSDMQCTFEVTPKFPLNLIVTPQSVAGYLYIGRQLHRIRKALWNVNSLSLKTCCGEAAVGKCDTDSIKSRMMVMRFCLINFCASLRSFFMLKLFSRDFAEYTGSSSGAGDFDNADLDVMRSLHEKYLDAIQTKMLRDRMVEGVLIPHMTIISELLRTHWTTGVPLSRLISQEDNLKKCWQVVKSFEGPTYSPDFHQLSWHFGRPPSYLTN